MSKKLREMIRENQKLNNINLRMFAVASKTISFEQEENNKSTKKRNKMNNKKNFKSSIIMALSAGKETTEGGSFKMYTGITPVGCKYVNPTKEQLTQMLGREWTKEQVYIKTDDKGIQQVNLMFPLTVDTTVNGEKVNFTVFQNITLKNAPRYKQDGSKFQVVDKWGEFTWVTEEEFINHTWPLSSTGKKLKIDPSNWRKAWQGEENLMKFLKPRLNIDSPFGYNKETGYFIDSKADLSKCECRLDNIANYFKGDVSEIQAGLNMMPENKVKAFAYVDEYEGKQRQAIAREYVNLASNKYNDLAEEIEKINNNKGTNFTLCELKEYKVESTQFAPSGTQMPETNNPFETVNSPWNS